MAYTSKVNKDIRRLKIFSVVNTVAIFILAVASSLNGFNTTPKTAAQLHTTYTNTTMTVTAYHKSGGTTALLNKPKAGRDVAVSRDRLDLFDKNVYVLCEDANLGKRRVTDLMHSSVENTIDVFMGSNEEAINFGKKICTVVPLKD